MLRFILGKSGSGKTTAIHNKICELVKEGNDKIIILVPDQSSFETEKEFLELLGAKDCKKVLVFGFSRLCRYVFELTGNCSDNVIDNGTRAVLMSLALEQLTDKLSLLKSKSGRSVVDLMLQTITDLKKCSVSSDMLRQGAKSVTDETLKVKLNETALVSDAFDALLSQSYIDPLDDLTRLKKILSENNIFSDYTVFCDGFSGFTVQQLKVLRLIMSQCKNIIFALTLDPYTNENEEVFATSNDTYKILKEFAKSDGIEIKAPVKTEAALRFKSDELRLLESGIFRKDYETSEKSTKDIQLFLAADSYAECEYVAQQIKNLVINEGYLYSDISIISHETSPYKGILNEMLAKYEIPYFMDIKSDVEVKPVIRLVTSIFKSVLGDFERDDVMSLLKTGLSSNSVDEISAFESYVYVWNVNKSGFKIEFTQNPRGFSDKLTDSDKSALISAEKVRKSIVEPLLSFKTEAKDKNGLEICELFYNLLLELGTPDALRRMYDSFQKSNEKSLGAEQIRIWNTFIGILDKMVSVIGKQTITLSRFYELLSLQISEIELLSIPQSVDCVIVTTAQRVRLPKQKAAFLIGCADGVFPAAPRFSGLFSAYELKQLEMSDISLGDDLSSLASLETFTAYSCMTSASHKLFISCPVSDSMGKKITQSSVFKETFKIFPNAACYSAVEYDFVKNSMLAAVPAFEAFSRSFGYDEVGFGSLLEYFESDEKFKNKVSILKRAKEHTAFAINDKSNAEKLFGSSLRISASQIEKFNKCRFSYFCNYGLNIRERRKAEINPMEYGTLVHYILEKFFSTYNKDEYSVMTEQNISDFVKSAVNEYLLSYFGGQDSKSGSFMYRLNVINSNVCVLLSHIIEEMTQSDFDVADCELKIGEDIPAYTIVLPDKHKIAVCGSVDRVDVMEKDGEKYLRVIDYKTGPKKFKLSDIIYGLNLQMLLYLSSINNNGSKRYGNTIPAGILYMPATVPVISSEKTDDEQKLNNKISKELTMNGLLLDDVKVIRGMDKSDSGKYIPVKVKLDTPVSLRSLATLEDFGKIFSKLENTVIQMGEDLYSGNIKASPVKGAYDACEYCPYDSVCIYHKSEPVNTFDTDNEEVIRQITQELLQADNKAQNEKGGKS